MGNAQIRQGSSRHSLRLVIKGGFTVKVVSIGIFCTVRGERK